MEDKRGRENRKERRKVLENSFPTGRNGKIRIETESEGDGQENGQKATRRQKLRDMDETEGEGVEDVEGGTERGQLG